jgi:hypothetical protein
MMIKNAMNIAFIVEEFFLFRIPKMAQKSRSDRPSY